MDESQSPVLEDGGRAARFPPPRRISSHYITAEREKQHEKTPLRELPKERGNGALRFPNKFLTAFGALDADLAAAAWHADDLLAVRTAVVAVLLVGQAGPEGQKAAVFPVPLLDVPRKGAEDIPEQQHVGEQIQHEAERHRPYRVDTGKEKADQTQGDRSDHQNYVQLIEAVAPKHEPPDPVGNPLSDTPEHRPHLLGKVLTGIAPVFSV